MYKVGIIGAGKVGTSFGLYFFKRGYLKLLGFYSRSFKNSIRAAKLSNSKAFDSLEDLVLNSDVIFITTPDDEIKNVFDEIKKLNIERKIICHCSGSLSSQVFFDGTTKNISTLSCHPILAISSYEDGYRDLSGAFFTLEGSKRAIDVISKELRLMNNPYKILESDKKCGYHLATVFISNLIIGLCEISVKLLMKSGFTKDEAMDGLSILAKKNLDKFFEIGAENALTGPVERGDIKTVKRHLKFLEDSNFNLEREIYKDLSLILLDIAQKKNRNRDYKKLREELERKK